MSKLNSFDKKIQNIKMKQELSKFTEIESKFHINGIEYKNIPNV